MYWSHCNLFVSVMPKYLADVTDSSVCPWSWYLASIVFFLLVQAYFTLARPLVEYASTVWDSYTQTDINKVEAVQRRAARYVANNHRNRSSVSKGSHYFFFLHQNQNIFFSNIGNQNIFLEKNHNPSLQVKWSLLYSLILFYCK
jgi:hypothetical protein